MDNYSNLDKILHRAVLSSDILSESLFDIEKALFLDKAAENKQTGGSVYILGLARAGTTILMREIYRSGIFASLTYQDMPFVMAPNLWGRVLNKNKKKTELAERAHGDGILVNSESPEALEEVFWKTFHGKEYIRGEKLVPHTSDSATLDEFENYQHLVRFRSEKGRYVSKNNNNILRITSLASRFSDATFLLVFRDPVTHAHSLLKQHHRFTNSSKFIRDYMGWLSHFEFGDNHKPFIFSGDFVSETLADTLEYWILVWCEVYGHILEIVQKEKYDNIYPVCYEKLCLDPDYWTYICKQINIPSHQTGFRLASQSSAESIDSRLLEKAYAIYHGLVQSDRLGSDL